MKTRWTEKLLVIAVCCIGVLFALSGCSKEIPKDEQLRQDGYNVEVKFDPAGGSFNVPEVFAIFIKSGSAVVPPSMLDLYASLKGYTLTGWYRGEIGEDGEIIYGDEWNFQNDRAYESMTLYARWRPDYVFRLNYNDMGTDKYIDVDAIEGALAEENQSLAGLRKYLRNNKNHNSEGVSITNLTLYKVYSDALKTQEIADFTQLTHPMDLENPVVTLYAEFLDGRFVFVKSPSEMKETKEASVTLSDFYLEENLDFGGENWSLPDNWGGKIVGNNKTISNLKKTYLNDENAYFGLFKRITGHIENLTFSNCAVEIKYNRSPSNELIRHCGFLAGEVRPSASLSNIIFASCFLDFEVSQDIGMPVTHEFSALNSYYYYLNESSSVSGISGTITPRFNGADI